MPDSPIRIAMWSGPRNISTALMRSWESRGDTAVVDEPLYAYYLHATGLDHPGRGEILASQPTDWRCVAETLTGPVPGGKPIFYQKHMAHHLLPEIGRDWLGALRHAFLIRDPREMLTSLMQVLPRPRVEDTGLPQQVDLFEQLAEATGEAPPVLDSKDVLDDPGGLLAALCDRLDVPFTERMLRWAPGPRATDGVWAPIWYASVERSTGFQPYRPKPDPVPGPLDAVYQACQRLYNILYAHRLTTERQQITDG